MKAITSTLTLAALLLLSCSLKSQSTSGKESTELKTNKNMKATVTEKNEYVHFHGMPYKGKILMVVSSPALSEQTGWPIGFWAAELTHALYVFQEAGYEVELASTEGGEIKMDGYSDPTHESGYSANDIITLGYMQQDWFINALKNTKKFTDADPSKYDAVFLVGGQGPMYTFYKNGDLEKFFVKFYDSGKPSAVVCHATSLLLTAKDSDGELLVKGKTWTGFANSEEDFADKAVGQKIQPFRIEDEARKLKDTNFKVAQAFSAYAIADGNLITGQQQNSGAEAAQMVVDMLEK